MGIENRRQNGFKGERVKNIPPFIGRQTPQEIIPWQQVMPFYGGIIGKETQKPVSTHIIMMASSISGNGEKSEKGQSPQEKKVKKNPEGRPSERQMSLVSRIDTEVLIRLPKIPYKVEVTQEGITIIEKKRSSTLIQKRHKHLYESTPLSSEREGELIVVAHAVWL